MKKIVFLVLLIFSSCKMENKDENTTEFKRITLSYSHSMSCKSLIIHIESYQRDNIDVSYKYIPHKGCNSNEFEFKSYAIDSIKFDEISENILKIDRLNIEKESQTMGLDGISTSISFYEKNKNTIMNIYNIWSPNYDTENRKLNDYMNVYTKLIKLAHIDSDSLF